MTVIVASNGNPLGSINLSGTSSVYTRALVNSNINAAANQPFTIEFWINPSGTFSSLTTLALFSTGTASGSSGYMSFFLGHPGLSAAGRYIWYFPTGSGVTSTANYTTGSWTHIALTRSAAGATNMYVNGAVAGPAGTNTAAMLAPAGSYWYFGASGDSLSANQYTGLFSNFRVVIGTVVYTGAFTPPTQPLTAGQFAGTNIAQVPAQQTQLLLTTPNNSNYLTDFSQNSYVLSNVGTAPTVGSSSPFASLNPAWIFTSDPLGSLSLNGSSQYVTEPVNTAYSFGTGDFTIEGWFFTTVSADQGLWDTRLSSVSTTGFACRLLTTTNTLRVIFNNASLFTTTQAITLNQWNHIAVVRISGTVTAYLNGTAMVGGSAAAAATATDNNMWVGKLQDAGFFYNGYISNFRVVKGVGIYTGAFTVPTAPLEVSQPGNNSTISAVSQPQTVLLLNTAGNSNFLKDTSQQGATATNVGSITANTLTPFTNADSISMSAGGPNNPPPTVEYLVVGGGGGAGSFGGGGGAGGYRTATGFSVPTTGSSLTITVGAGGTGGQNTIADSAGNGVPSSLAASTTITAAGGGYGGSRDTPGYTTGAAGGSGGGGASQSNAGGAGNTPSTSPSQGNAGGSGGADGGSIIDYPSGGGGGAGAAGQSGVQDQESGYGGVGNISAIITSLVGTGNITAGSTTLTMSAVTAGEVDVGTQITGSGIPAAQSSSITSITWATNIVTVNFTSGPAFAVGMDITLSGTTGAVYDGIFKVTAVPGGGTSVEFASTQSTGQGGAGGTISSATTFITAFGTGTGSTGTYVMNNPATATTTGVAITSSGTYFAGGGGGSTYSTLTAGAGGAGGGGAGSNTQGVNGTAGATNTGGGGGGGGYLATGGAGGSGKVIVRYADTYDPPTSAPGATATVSGGYRVYQFNTSGYIGWNPTGLTYVDFIVVAGGGGGGYGTVAGGINAFGGGGGAGGVTTGTLEMIAGSTATVTVGGGGAGGIAASSTNAVVGTNSSIVYGARTITALGGGFGAFSSANPGGAGGSGGGGFPPGAATQPTSASGGRGWTGGTVDGGAGQGGGGGGAGLPGFSGLPAAVPNRRYGGYGYLYSEYGAWGTDVSNSTVPSTGKGYFAGGGAGGGATTSGTALGGPGGGGNAAQVTAGTAGLTNTGGGGGGGGSNSANLNGGAGGSGIIIFRYPSAFAAAVSTSGTVAVTTSGNYRYYAFTAGSGTIQFV